MTKIIFVRMGNFNAETENIKRYLVYDKNVAIKLVRTAKFC